MNVTSDDSLIAYVCKTDPMSCILSQQVWSLAEELMVHTEAFLEVLSFSRR